MENASKELFGMDRQIFVKALSAVTPTASKDWTRPHLAGVLLETRPEDGIVRLVTTDGHRLTKLDVAALPDWDLQPAELLMPIGEVEALIKSLRGKAQSYTEPVTASVKGGEITFRNVITKRSTGFALADEKFPPYAKVIPDYANKARSSSDELVGGKVGIGFNARYMADVQKVAAFCANETSGGVKASFGGNRDPIRIDMENADVSASAIVVIMPMRI